MGVEAARAALRSAAGAAPPERILFATANPPYLDKTNAAVIHAALDLPASALALDFGGAVRSGVGALLAAADARVPTLAVLSDVRTGLPGGSDEKDGGAAAAGFLCGGDGSAGGGSGSAYGGATRASGPDAARASAPPVAPEGPIEHSAAPAALGAAPG